MDIGENGTTETPDKPVRTRMGFRPLGQTWSRSSRPAIAYLVGTTKGALGTLVALLSVLSACVVAPPPVEPPADSPAESTTTIPAAGETASAPSMEMLYALDDMRPRSSFTLTFATDVPPKVQESFWRAANTVTAKSGIEFNPGVASAEGSRFRGEIRVRIGKMCQSVTDREAGCATRYSSFVAGEGNVAYASDVSIAPETIAASYLDNSTAHELGHAVGLLHVAKHPAAPQVMNPIASSSIRTYQNGDSEGLKLQGQRKYSQPADSGALVTVQALLLGTDNVDQVLGGAPIP